MNYITREMESLIRKLEKEYPVIMVCGQHQTGKSTMLRHLSEDKTYVSFDKAKIRDLARTDPELFFETYGTNIFIDEFQRVPDILLEIKSIVDENKYQDNKINHTIYLSCSQKFDMMKNISETLAGRVAVLNLLPLSEREINGTTSGVFSPKIGSLAKKETKKETMLDVFRKIFKGGMPEVISNKELDRDVYYSSYIDTYIQRDVSALEQVGKLDEFRALVTYMAANTACELKYDTISKAIGVSAPTIKEWVTILEKSGIIYILHPYYSNVSKRLVKTPKCYFIDTGLAAYLTSWPTPETLMNGNSAGAFFETYVVSEILKSYYNNGKTPNLYYYRDVDLKEIDLLVVEGDTIYPIEIKKSKSPSEPDKNFSVLNKLNVNVAPGLIICMTDELYPLSKSAWLCPVSLI